MILDIHAHYHPRAYTEALDRIQHDLPEPPSATARRFYYDTVGHGSQAALLCAWKAFGATHILPGSDFPVLLS
jgi:hypothetical protein